ncbi:RagB/SusD family nutrient uptake outer membrane protein [Chryseobacterium sp. RLHN22]|uniref:RagB/SusD family nutrient uptake outer membrane protein n=1 Tax=Chryseobacterium sp. RLHN22 TaxID=3437885 RepID=UPI003D9AEF16
MKTIVKPYMIIIAVSAALTASSCEQWIETDFPSNQLPTELVFEDEQTAEAALAGLYANLWNNSLISGGSDGMGLLLGMYTDEIASVSSPGSNSIIDLYYNQQISSNLIVSNVWTNAYQHIYAANSIIEGVKNSKTLSQSARNRITGETLFIRSLLYFYLQQIYGEIPYTDTTDYQINSKLSKLSADDLLSRIDADLEQAVNLLPSAYRNAERIYVNKNIANLLWAKLKILRKQWPEAENLLQLVLQSSDYAFQNDITKVFQKTGTHIIWQLKPRNSGDATKEAALYNFSGIPTTYMLNVDLVNSFSANDLRKQIYIATVTSQGQTNYRAVKYKNLAGANTSEDSVIFRLEEVYLLYAEVLIQQNKVAEAIPYINRTRQRAGLSALSTGLNPTSAKEELKQEKRKEFFSEHGTRFFDLKRWGQLDQLASVKTNWKSYHRQWPLPQKELLLNPNLNPQNEGY